MQNHELLRRSESQIIGECKLRISHVLAALPGQRLDELSEVNSHPIALMQCGEFLKAHPQLKAVERDDTAGSNFTRFLLLADRYHADRHTGSARADKASLVFSLPHTQGSLSKVLTILSFYDINLTKIQSMPIIGCEWEYRFYVDVSFADYTRYRQSIDAITPLTKDFKILGEYAAFNE